VIILGEKGHPDFKALRHAIVAAQESLVFVAFDLLHLNGHDLRRMHLAERRAILADLVPDDGAIQFSRSHEGDAAALDRMGLGGMVSKRADSPYRSDPSKAWLKMKCFDEAEFEIRG
jgi:ATP-dependent DNA ligase